MDKEVLREIGHRLKASRLALKLKQDAVAAEVGVIRQTVSGWENGRSMPESRHWYKLAPLYGESLDYLVYGVRENVRGSSMLQEIFRSPGRPMLALSVRG